MKPDSRTNPVSINYPIQSIAGLLEEYWSSYMAQPGASRYMADVVLKDAIYGLGTALDEKYETATGFDQFQRDLHAYLSKQPAVTDNQEAQEAEIQRIVEEAKSKLPSALPGSIADQWHKLVEEEARAARIADHGVTQPVAPEVSE